MARMIDNAINEISEKYIKDGNQAIELHNRILDYFLMIFHGTFEELHQLFYEISKIHPSLIL